MNKIDLEKEDGNYQVFYNDKCIGYMESIEDNWTLYFTTYILSIDGQIIALQSLQQYITEHKDEL